MGLDKDGDGVLSGDEIPERMSRNMERVDGNGDGKLDKAELEKVAERIGQFAPQGERRRNPGGRGPGDPRREREEGGERGESRRRRPDREADVRPAEQQETDAETMVSDEAPEV